MKPNSYSPSTWLTRLPLPLLLLIGQAVALGTLLAFNIVGGNSLFLQIYGAGLIPYVYIVVAVLGSLIFYGMAALQNRFSLAAVLMATTSGVLLFYLLAWFGLVTMHWDWIAFTLMVSFSMMLQLGFVVLGGQAGRIFHVQEIKRFFPRIVAGFVVGFIVGGLLAPLIVSLRGQTADVILGAAVAAAIMLTFLLLIVRHFYDELKEAENRGPAQPTKSLRRLLLRRFVLVIVSYQFLSAMATQLVNYIFLNQSAVQFTTEAELAQFFSLFTVVMNGIDLLFLIFVAGWLLVYFGLRWGLVANPLANLIVLVAQLGVGYFLGIETTLFFWLVMAAWVGDVAFTDGTTRGSINTAYQALPVEERAVVQTGVEGIGFPLALGLTGVLLLLFNLIPNLSILHVTLFTIVVTALWLFTAVQTYRDYGRELTKALKKRTLNLNEVFVADRTTTDLVETLLLSTQTRDVLVGLELLASSPEAPLEAELVPLLNHADEQIRLNVLAIIGERGITAAAAAVKALLAHEQNDHVRGMALRTFCALNSPEGLALCGQHLDAATPETRLGAIVGYLQVSEPAERSRYLNALSSSARPLERELAARALAEIGQEADYTVVLPLLTDAVTTVRTTAILAAGELGHHALIPPILEALSEKGLRSAVTVALVKFKDAVLPDIQRILSTSTHPQGETAARICGQIKTAAALSLLVDHLNHPNGRVRTQILLSLARNGPQLSSTEHPQLFELLRQEQAYAAYVLAARRDIAGSEALTPLRHALEDEFALILERVGYLCALLYDPHAILEAIGRLRRLHKGQQALAYEMLEVTLPKEAVTLIAPLFDPRLSLDERTKRLQKGSKTNSLAYAERVYEIARGTAGYDLMDWTKACAIYGGGQAGLNGAFVAVVEAACFAEAPQVREAAVWSLHRLAPERFQSHLSSLWQDRDERITRLLAKLAPG